MFFKNFYIYKYDYCAFGRTSDFESSRIVEHSFIVGLLKHLLPQTPNSFIVRYLNQGCADGGVEVQATPVLSNLQESWPQYFL